MEEREEMFEESMQLQEVPQSNLEPELEYKEKTKDEIYSDQELEELLQQLREMKEQVQMGLAVREGYQNYTVTNVEHYNQDVKLVRIENGEAEYLNLSVVIAEEPNTGEITMFYYLDGKEANIVELNTKYESSMPIIKLMNDTKKNMELPSEEQDPELTKVELVDLEERKREKTSDKENSEEENMPSIKEFYEPEKSPKDKEKSQKISNLRGEVDLDQQVNGETLRKILGLGEEYECIAPVPASSVGVKGSSRYCFIAVKGDKTFKVLEEGILEEDRQEGTNPYKKDSKVDRDGSVYEESSISGYKIVNRPNLYLTVGYDQNSSTRETHITDVSGREGRNNEIGYELEKNGDGWQESDARNSLRTEEGIGKTDEMAEKKNNYEAIESEADKIEDIDNDPSNNTYDHFKSDDFVPGKEEVTFEQWANELGESTRVLIERYERESNKISEPENIVNEIENDYGRLMQHKR